MIVVSRRELWDCVCWCGLGGVLLWVCELLLVIVDTGTGTDTGMHVPVCWFDANPRP